MLGFRALVAGARAARVLGAVRPTARAYSTAYPDHIVVCMPALSPTMTQGTLVSWSTEIGEEVAAGDQLGEIETDKASMSFDSSEDGFVAKHLMEAGSTADLGVPVLILCEDAADVAAFADYVAEAPAAAAAAPAPAAPAAAPSSAPSPAPSAKPAAGAPIAVSSSGSALDGKLFALAEQALTAKYPSGVPTSF